MYFVNKAHEERFHKHISANKGKCDRQYLVLVYILSASTEVWRKSLKGISGGTVNWSAIDLRGISMMGYSVFQLARDFAFGSVHCTLRDLCDVQIIPDRLIDLMFEGIQLGREGYRRVKADKSLTG